jgi:hypothetical protein
MGFRPAPPSDAVISHVHNRWCISLLCLSCPSVKEATIQDLSVLSGSSPSTVGAVLNGSWRNLRIAVSTAQAIFGLAEQHQYTANLQARGLRRSRSGLGGLASGA